MLDIELSTRQGYVRKLDKRVRPRLGRTPVARIDAETLESLYAALRKCRDHCGGRKFVEHRKAGEHVCTDKCRPHACKPLSPASIRQIHWILSGALGRAVRWRWIALNPADQADKPGLPVPKPHPPTSTEAARLVTAAWDIDADWGAFVWTAMTTGARRSELCVLRWTDVQLDTAVVALERAVYVDEDGELREKDTKTHQERRVALDPETVEVLQDQLARAEARCEELSAELATDAHVFSPAPDGSAPLAPDTATQKFARMATRLKLTTNLHALRHYSATELIAAGVDVRTVAGRLGHGGGGATTLRVYAAWLSESDQRAAGILAARMPRRPESNSHARE